MGPSYKRNLFQNLADGYGVARSKEGMFSGLARGYYAPQQTNYEPKQLVPRIAIPTASNTNDIRTLEKLSSRAKKSFNPENSPRTARMRSSLSAARTARTPRMVFHRGGGKKSKRRRKSKKSKRRKSKRRKFSKKR